MSWKATGQPTIRKHREKWTVRIEGIDTETGNRRPRQISTYASQRTALAAARKFRTNERRLPLIEDVTQGRGDRVRRGPGRSAWWCAGRRGWRLLERRGARHQRRGLR